MSQRETFSDSVRQQREARNANIFEAADRLRAAAAEMTSAAETLRSERVRNEALVTELRQISTAIPEAMAQAMSELSEALESQVADHKKASSNMEATAKKVSDETTKLSKKLNSESTSLAGAQKKLEDQARHLTRAMEKIGQKELRMPLWQLLLLVLPGVAAVAAVVRLAHQAGIPLL